MSFSEDFPNFELNISDTETYIPDLGRDLDEELFVWTFSEIVLWRFIHYIIFCLWNERARARAELKFVNFIIEN